MTTGNRKPLWEVAHNLRVAVQGLCAKPPPRASIHAKILQLAETQLFQSTRPYGARLPHGMQGSGLLLFQSTRPCGARRSGELLARPLRGVSIHAPVRGATWDRPRWSHRPHRFNPRARTGRDRATTCYVCSGTGFQSTRPHGARRVAASIASSMYVLFQSTRPARGATLPAMHDGTTCYVFQSTRPARGATRDQRGMHAVHEPMHRFNPRAPRGARRSRIAASASCDMFQSTRPARGATHRCEHVRGRFQSTRPRGARRMLHGSSTISVSIHAPRAGRDVSTASVRGCVRCFNPRAPRGARRRRVACIGMLHSVSIHAPRAGRDRQLDA